jgi:hypothetical protein
VDGVHPPRCAVVEWRWRVLLLVCRCVWSRVLLIPLQYWRVLLSCRVPFFVGCVVCGWCVSVCGVRSVGYPLCAPPSSWWWVGLSWMVGWHGEVGGIVREGRWCQWLPLLSLLSSLSDISVPFCLCGGPVEWRGGVLFSVFGLGPPLYVVLFALQCLVFLCVVRCGVGVVWWCCFVVNCVPLFSSSPPVFVSAVTALLVCVVCFLSGLCHCGIVVMVVCGLKGRMVCGVWCSLSALLVLWCVWW